MDNNILYIGDFKFSLMNAEFELVLGNGYLLKELGYSVIFVGNDQNKITLDNEFIEYDEFKIYNLDYKKNSSDVKKIFKLHKQLINIIDIYKPSMIICYGSLSLSIHLLLIKNYCKKKNIKFVVNCVDLPLINNGNTLSRFVRKIDRKIRNIIYRNSDGLIAVSDYICKKIKNKHQSIVLPPIRKYISNDYSINDNNWNSFMYAGFPFPLDGRQINPGCYKDRLDVAIEIFSRLEQKNINFQFDIYGITKDEYLRAIPSQDQIVSDSKCIRFHGRIEKTQCDREIVNHSFMVLLRDENRTSLAGFSTKIVDSISLGTPVILNPIGDVKKYLIDGYNSLFISNISKDIAVSEFEKIVTMPKSEIEVLKENCIKDKTFYYLKYKRTLENFVNNVTEKVIK